MKKNLSIILIFSLLFALSSCAISTEYELLNDEAEIVSIDIVEAVYDESSEMHIQYLITNIEDVSEFMTKFRKVKHTTSLLGGAPSGIEFSSLVLKISYENGEHEMFNDTARSFYDNEEGFCFYGDNGLFNKENFYSLLFEHIQPLKTQAFNYMRNKQEINSIDIVECNEKNSEKEVVKKVENIQAFLDDLESIDYTYVNHSFANDQNQQDGDSRAIRLTYNDGSKEIFTHNHREQHQLYNSSYGTYIGTFNEAQFNALIEKHMQN